MSLSGPVEVEASGTREFEVGGSVGGRGGGGRNR